MNFIVPPDTARFTVCNACLRVACASGDLPCSYAPRAGLTCMSVGELKSRGSTEPLPYWRKPNG